MLVKICASHLWLSRLRADLAGAFQTNLAKFCRLRELSKSQPKEQEGSAYPGSRVFITGRY